MKQEGETCVYEWKHAVANSSDSTIRQVPGTHSGRSQKFNLVVSSIQIPFKKTLDTSFDSTISKFVVCALSNHKKVMRMYKGLAFGSVICC